MVGAKMTDLPKAIVEQIARMPLGGGSNLETARRFLAWMKTHRDKALTFHLDNGYHAYTVVATLPTPAGKSAADKIDVCFVVVGKTFEKAMGLAPFWPYVIFAAQGNFLTGTPIRGWTLEEYERQINAGVVYEEQERQTYVTLGNPKK
jgi:hypothetical protein